ncbi:MAG: hypothetical protein ACOYN2_03275 [Patescibacteria group bacterium]
MKTIAQALCATIGTLIFTSNALAYTLTDLDKSLADKLSATISKEIQAKGESYRQKVVSNLEKSVTNSDERNSAMASRILRQLGESSTVVPPSTVPVSRAVPAGSYKSIGDIVYSKDGKSLAYGAWGGKNWIVVKDGFEIAKYSAVSALTYLPDNTLVFGGMKRSYIGKATYDQWFISRNGVEDAKRYDVLGYYPNTND